MKARQRRSNTWTIYKALPMCERLKITRCYRPIHSTSGWQAARNGSISLLQYRVITSAESYSKACVVIVHLAKKRLICRKTSCICKVYCNILLKSIQFLRNYETDRNFYGNVSGYSDLIYSNLMNLSRAIPRTVESFMCGIVPFSQECKAFFPLRN